MSTSVTVTLNFRDFRTTVSPSTLLNDVAAQACAHFHVDALQYGLQYQNAELDLSLPFRLANLPRGCKLQLAKSETAGTVTLRLQIMAPEKDETYQAPSSGLVQKFPASASLEAVLARYEEVLGTQLVGRRGHYDVSKLGRRILCAYDPVVQTISSVIGSDKFGATTLKSLGIVKGNHSLRVRFKKEEVGFEELGKVGEDVKKDVKEEAIVPETETVESSEVGKKEAEKEIHQVENKESPTPVPASVPTPEPTSAPLPTSHIQVYRNTNSHISHEDNDESVYEMTVDQAKVYQTLLNKQAGNGPMTTRKMREEAAAARTPKVDNCLIRIRFPDHTTVELELGAKQTLRDLHDLLVDKILLLSDDQMVDSAPVFELFTLHPQTKLLSTSDDFAKQLVRDCGLGRRSMLIYRENGPARSQYVRQEYLNNSKSVDEMDEVKLEQNMKPEQPSANEVARSRRQLGSSSSSGKKVPKWFKMGKR